MSSMMGRTAFTFKNNIVLRSGMADMPGSVPSFYRQKVVYLILRLQTILYNPEIYKQVLSANLSRQ